jgi:hypothetical protein
MMRQSHFIHSTGLLALGLTFFSAPAAEPQAPAKVPPKLDPSASKIQPKLEPVAETKLLMEGLAHANFRGVERLLQQKPADARTWTFVRGQALLIAETGNLLMMRPPKTSGQAAWFDRAIELRSTAQQLAKAASAQDLERSKSLLVSLASTCNRCHQSFRVGVEITAFDDKQN